MAAVCPKRVYSLQGGKKAKGRISRPSLNPFLDPRRHVRVHRVHGKTYSFMADLALVGIVRRLLTSAVFG